MLPGIAAFVLYQGNHLPQLVGGKDGAYSAVLTFLPTGLKGLSVAALTAAIVASLAGKVNSISTIYTLDIYKKFIKIITMLTFIALIIMRIGIKIYIELHSCMYGKKGLVQGVQYVCGENCTHT